MDPFHIANEGKTVISVREAALDAAFQVLRDHPLGRHAAVIATSTEKHSGRLILDTGFGRRIMTEPEGEPTPADLLKPTASAAARDPGAG